MPFIATSNYLDNYFTEESHFCQLYPLLVQKLDRMLRSPLMVAYRAANFLANKSSAKILDIGSGSGKFCLAGAYSNRSALFYGVEQHRWLIDYARSARIKLGKLNVEFIYENFTHIDFREYDNFYFYNSFLENTDGTDKIDNSIPYSVELYDYYNLCLKNKLDEMPVGTRVVTFKSPEQEIPASYALDASEMNNLLKFWIKK